MKEPPPLSVPRRYVLAELQSMANAAFNSAEYLVRPQIIRDGKAEEYGALIFSADKEKPNEKIKAIFGTIYTPILDILAVLPTPCEADPNFTGTDMFSVLLEFLKDSKRTAGVEPLEQAIGIVKHREYDCSNLMEIIRRIDSANLANNVVGSYRRQFEDAFSYAVGVLNIPFK